MANLVWHKYVYCTVWHIYCADVWTCQCCIIEGYILFWNLLIPTFCRHFVSYDWGVSVERGIIAVWATPVGLVYVNRLIIVWYLSIYLTAFILHSVTYVYAFRCLYRFIKNHIKLITVHCLIMFPTISMHFIESDEQQIAYSQVNSLQVPCQLFWFYAVCIRKPMFYAVKSKYGLLIMQPD